MLDFREILEISFQYLAHNHNQLLVNSLHDLTYYIQIYML
jgi:hypothetical protein